MRFTLWRGEQQSAHQQPAQNQPQRLGTASGKFDGTPATFEFWGQNEQLTALRALAGGQTFDLVFSGGPNEYGEFLGQMTPCAGGACPCNFFEEGQDYYMGSCDLTNPEYRLSFSFGGPSQ